MLKFHLLILLLVSCTTFNIEKNDMPAIQKSEISADFSSLENVYDLIIFMKTSNNLQAIEHKIEKLLEHKSYQHMFIHYNRDWRPNYLPPQTFKNMLLSLKFERYYSKHQSKIIDTMRPHWINLYNHPKQLQNDIHQLKSIDFRSKILQAIERAKLWLPPTMPIPNFYLFLHANGGSAGFATPKLSQGIDIFQLERLKDGGINLDKLFAIVAHESHHLGIKIPALKEKNSQKQMLYKTISMFIPEGVANKFVDNLDGGCVPKIAKNQVESIDAESKKDWQKHSLQYKDIYSTFFAQLQKAANNNLSQKDFDDLLQTYWLAGSKGPLYFLGSEIMGAIYFGLGKDKMFEVIENPFKMLEYYNFAVTNNPELRKCIIIPDKYLKMMS